MEVALAYAKQREQFGRPIGSFEMIQRKFASLAVDVYAADAAWMVTSGMVDRGGIDFSLETAACKVFASELVYHAANEALQVAGGIGYSKEYPYEQAVRDARINLIFEGTNEIQRALIALSGLQQPGEELKAIGKAFKDPLRSIGAISGFLSERVKKQLLPNAKVDLTFERRRPPLESSPASVAWPGGGTGAGAAGTPDPGAVESGICGGARGSIRRPSYPPWSAQTGPEGKKEGEEDGVGGTAISSEDRAGRARERGRT